METIEVIKTIGSIAGPIIATWSIVRQIRKERSASQAKPKVSTRILTSPLEISYNLQGTMLCAGISYRTENKGAFVDRVDAIFTHTETNETHTFEAQYFLEYRPDPTGQSLLSPLSFKEPFAPFGINIERYENKILLFTDPVCGERINAELDKLRPELGNLLRKLPQAMDGQNIPDEEFLKTQLATRQMSR